MLQGDVGSAFIEEIPRIPSLRVQRMVVQKGCLRMELQVWVVSENRWTAMHPVVGTVSGGAYIRTTKKGKLESRGLQSTGLGTNRGSLEISFGGLNPSDYPCR